jgi:hypothetical protein
MHRQIVVAFRFPTVALSAGPEGEYLPRARSLCSRGEALGGRLVAWSAALLAMAWDTDSVEEAVLLATSIREDAAAPERAWAVGMAEGELEALAPDGARMHLAWGKALLLAATLSRVARGGEILVDGEMPALRGGHLAVLGARTATDSGLQVRGWKLDMENPWKGYLPDDAVEDATLELPPILPKVTPPPPRAAVSASGQPSLTTPLPGPAEPAGRRFDTPVPEYDAQELTTSEVLRIVEASSSMMSIPPPPMAPKRAGQLASRVRRLAAGDKSKDAMEAVAELRRERARVETSGTPSTRCQAGLALAMTLSIAGRAEDALLEALDALARAREVGDPKAIDACTALLAKLYSRAGHVEHAAALLRGA